MLCYDNDIKKENLIFVAIGENLTYYKAVQAYRICKNTKNAQLSDKKNNLVFF